jgi:hypothetical protein
MDYFEYDTRLSDSLAVRDLQKEVAALRKEVSALQRERDSWMMAAVTPRPVVTYTDITYTGSYGRHRA